MRIAVIVGDSLSHKLPTEGDERSENPVPGQVIAGKYRVEKLVGRGGMGVVVSAQHVALGQTVAIKVLATAGLDLARRVEANARFLREGQSAARLTSDHVVRIYDVGTLDSGEPFMVMELLRGEDLATLLERQGPAPVEVAVEYVVQACDAVAEAHASGIVHRDLKPSNLFVSRRNDGRALVKVLDFGISKALSASSDPFEGSLTATRSVVGSPYYMSPEQVRDAKRVDARTDVWSLGMILYELLIGEPAFNADTLPGICAAIAADAPVPVRERRPDVPPEVEAIIMRCLEKDASKRFQTVSDLVKALTPFLPHSPASSTLYAARPPGYTPSAAPKIPPDALTLAPASGPRRSTDGAFVVTDPPSAVANTLASAPGDVAKPAAVPRAVDTTPKAKSSSKSESADATLLSPSGRSIAPARSGSERRRLAVFAATAVSLVAVLAVVLARSSKPMPEPAPAPSAPILVERFTMTVDSTPSGANVLDADRVIGTTPFTTVLDNASVRASPRRLTLRLDGYEPYEIVQGPSEAPVHLSASLSRVRGKTDVTEATMPSVLSVPAPRTPERPKIVAPKSPVHRPAAAAAAPAGPSDIRLER